MLTTALLCLALADDTPLQFHPDKVFDVIPGSMLMNVEHMTEAKPASITREPAYKNKPWYGTLTFGDPGEPIVFALDEDDDAAVLYADLNHNGDLTDDAKPGHERQITPEDKRTPQLKMWIYDLFTFTIPVKYADNSQRDLPVTVRTYGKVCRDLYNHMKPDLVYWNSYYRAGSATFGDVAYPIAVKDQNTDGRFDTLRSDKILRGDVFYIDTNRNGIFETRTESAALDKPFEVDGAAYEVDKISPSGDRISFKRSAKQIEVTTLKVGQLAPDFEIPGAGKLSSLRGKVVLIDFWATWCAPCLAEMPNVIKVNDAFKDRGLVVVGVSIDKESDAAKVRDLAAAKSMAWTQVHDHAQKIARPYFVTAIPATFLIGPDGRILASYLRGEDLHRRIEQAIANLPKGP